MPESSLKRPFSPLKVRRGYCRPDAHDLYYEIAGQGPPLLLIHGLGGSTRDWGLQLPALTGSFRVISIDLRGHGRSSRPATGYTIPTFAADTARLLGALSIPAAHVMGISLGGMVALQLALDFPDLVRGLVIVNSTPELPRDRWRQRLELGQRLLVTRLFGMTWTARMLARRLFPREDQRTLRQGFERRWAENDPRIYLATVKGMSGWSVTRRLSCLAAPTLIVAARQDFIPMEAKQICLDRIPRAELAVVEDSGHATPADQPEVFNRVVLDFLARLEDPGSTPGRSAAAKETPA
jgi:pimeloyl-ACP methyl ester carboxylesterase